MREEKKENGLVVIAKADQLYHHHHRTRLYRWISPAEQPSSPARLRDSHSSSRAFRTERLANDPFVIMLSHYVAK